MSTTLIVILTFATVTLWVVGVVSFGNDVFFRYRQLLNERVNDLMERQSPAAMSPLFRDLQGLGEHAAAANRSLATRVRDWLAQSGTGLDVSKLGLYCLGSIVVAILALPVLGLPWKLAPLAVVAGTAAPLVGVSLARRRRTRLLTRQLPEAFDMMARVVRAGRSVQSALQLVAEDFQSPISDEFALCYEQQNLGRSPEAALRDLAHRTGNMELQIFVVGLLVQTRTGGNLTEFLETLADTVRKRMRLQAKLKTLTGEGRLQAGVLFVLPFASFGMIYFLSPDYLDSLFAHPWLLGGTIASQAVGALWIQSIVNRDG